MEDFLQSLTTLDPMWVYASIFFLAFLENLFPPSPSDIAVVLGGALASSGRGHFLAALTAGVLGSTLGFMTMYGFGRWMGSHVLKTGKIRFLRPDTLQRLEGWFSRYGYWLIVANRFLTGTRAVVSFFAGVSRLDLPRTALLSLVSSILWYGILVSAGSALGQNWQKIGTYLESYSWAMMTLGLAVAVALVLRAVLNKRRRPRA